MRVLIIGGSGFLGTELVGQALAAGWRTAATYHSRPRDLPGATWHRLDLRLPGRLDALLAEVAPDAVLNVTSGQADWAVTADGSVRVALAAAPHPCRLVHVSSDAVFSGSRVHYDESCLPDPVTPYGAAKAAAETAVRLLVPDAAVARTSLIVGHGRSAHERRVRALAADPRSGALFTDDFRCPVHVTDLAAALCELTVSEASGMFHLAGADAVSRYDLGVLLARREGLDPSRLPSARRADSALPGALDVRLDSRATQSHLRTRLRGAREFLGS
ncbi:dTDP-4-dehydrorhamnose reductase [Streptomyces albus]|uniref:dTDP-4-dehydrorhamnose reductase n=1 Tax=Streptomyces albus (strain ATCC 21838 / DSM 41398 / FERM P-419 / JCM 4703 / NBRC 107858) TaxID=1081613 RepID=A0A0B5EV99_STRA4|nr:dTDP-4-dehydrorhamnose reductase [Streptomyces albus]AOU80016.1 dTDP-4-dehydrorhamnose reductase [Streptomyces albus]AYN35734.1 dTDP-4-dehydrorhamnose reductase [Streptomyces albus]